MYIYIYKMEYYNTCENNWSVATSINVDQSET